MKKFENFNYTILNKEYLPFERSLIVDLQSAVIIGWKKKDRIWSDHPRGFVVEEKVFYIVQDGAEYGALVANPSLYGLCGNVVDSFQIHEEEFETTFE